MKASDNTANASSALLIAELAERLDRHDLRVKAELMMGEREYLIWKLSTDYPLTPCDREVAASMLRPRCA